MDFKNVLSFLFFLLVLFLVLSYLFFPFNQGEFLVVNENKNFSIDGSKDLQFYENMRFQSKSISYLIEGCPLQRYDDMERAFEIVESETVLDFYPVDFDEEIYVSCSERNKVENGLFVAGEGGPTNITKAGDFNVIFNGEISLIRDSKCSSPNVGIHELFHVLGFNHSDNPGNIMYPVNKCNQEISEDMINLISELYSLPSNPDLVFEDVSAEISGRSLDISFTVRNFGFGDSGESKVVISSRGNILKEVEIQEIKIGYGRTISLQNVFVKQLNADNLELFIETEFQELDKENNKINLEIKSN